jgi:hypothetical protein
MRVPDEGYSRITMSVPDEGYSRITMRVPDKIGNPHTGNLNVLWSKETKWTYIIHKGTICYVITLLFVI